MENCDVPIHPQEHDSLRGRRISARQPNRTLGLRRKCPCCSDDQEPSLRPKRQHSATSANPPQKRKRTSVARPSNPSAEHPEVLNVVPTPLPSIQVTELPEVLNLVPTPAFAISPADLPVVSSVAPCSPQRSTAALQDDAPLMIHNHSVEEYQRIYHEVVDDMLKYKSGRLRPYSLGLGRRIKQKLWERLNRPMFTTSTTEDGRVHVDFSYGAGINPPLYDVDTLREPKPRAENSN